MSFINKLLKISEQYSFIKPVLDGKHVSYFKYGPFGELLRLHISNEWINDNVIYRDIPIFPFHDMNKSDQMVDGFKQQFLEARNICRNTLPFGITFSRIPRTQSIQNKLSTESMYFRPAKTTELKSITFVTPEEGRQYFHFWQRQRRIWWRQFSADPGRFSLTEIKTDRNTESTDIQAKFEWGTESVETVRFLSGDVFENLSEQDQELFKFKNRKKKEFPNIIESTTNLEIATFCFLCDAYYEEIRLDNDELRKCIRLHRKLAPYKAAFAIECKNNSQREELKDLAEYLALNIKKAAISVLHIEQLCRDTKDELFKYYDLLGIPYVIVLKPSTLSEGIFGLRSRETTLEELLHIDQLVDHLELLCRNY